MDFPTWFAELIKRNAQPNIESIASPAISIMPPPTFKADQPATKIDTLTVHIGPKGGKYRFNSKGKKIYLSA